MFQMNFKMNIKYCQDIDNNRNNDFYLKYTFCSSNFKLKGKNQFSTK